MSHMFYDVVLSYLLWETRERVNRHVADRNKVATNFYETNSHLEGIAQGHVFSGMI